MSVGVTLAVRLRKIQRRISHSIKLRLVLVFLLLAASLTLVFIIGAQQVFSVGWREAARPLLADYVDRVVADIASDGPPSVARARALADRLPLTVHIIGPAVNWSSHPGREAKQWARSRPHENSGGDEPDLLHLLQRTTADGHTLVLGIDGDAFERRPKRLGYVLAVLLLLTLTAWLYIRHLLKPLDAIGAGAQRFGSGDFSEPIPTRSNGSSGELGELAATLNTMGRDIHQMLEAKRALLLAISHELRSPLTRARLNTELLPESPDVQPQREALLRDLQEMAMLISDLLESERLAERHAPLQREPTDLPALVMSVVAELAVRHAAAERVSIDAEADLPKLEIDPARMRLMLRNLLDNAFRHGAAAAQTPEVRLQRAPDGGIVINVRDYGPGVPESHLSQLAQAFYRLDSARTRATGGVGLGLYLCRLITQAHGGTFEIRNAKPGLSVRVSLPFYGM